VSAIADAIVRGGSAPTDLPTWVGSAIADLRASEGRCLVHVGPHQLAEIHALAYAMNEALGARGISYTLIEPVVASPIDQARLLRDLADDMRAGRVRSLFIIDSNPVFTAPATLGFAAR
jgi:hypothetical protein